VELIHCLIHANPLYDSGCPGYAQAYETQQCNANPLYSQSCPGYQQAYYDQQCSFDPLYDTGCSGYQQAYYDQQCSANPLYDSQCPGYAQAYEDNQCSINPLFSTNCSGYQQAYHAQQCGLSALYASDCPGYQEAYATQMLLEQQSESTVATIAEPTVIVTSDPVAALTTVSSTGDAVVDSIIAAPTIVAISQPETTNEPIQDTSSTVDEPLAEAGGGDDSGPEGERDTEGDSVSDGDTKSGTSSNSTRDKVKKAMTEKAMALADDMSNAATIEAQKAVQAQVLAVMGYVPGFGSYGGTIGGGAYADAQMYAPTIVPESKRGLRNGLAQQILHDKIVESQYAR
jgi:hypothetical protein